MSILGIFLVRNIKLIVYVFLAIIMFILISLNPINAILLSLALFILIGLIFPKSIFLISLISVAISPQYLLPEGLFFLEISSIHKLVILFTLIPYLILKGLREKFNILIIMYIFMLFTTFFISKWHPNLDLLQVIKSFFGLTLGWFIFNLNWDTNMIKKSLVSISLLPIISVVIGVILHILDIRLVFDLEYNDVLRLQGSNIAPHLAMLAFMGFAAGINENLRSKSSFFLIVAMIDFVIVILTGTRGAMLATFFLLSVYVYSQVKKVLTFNKYALFRLMIFLLITIAVVLSYWPTLEKRMAGTVIESTFNTSGRIDAWEFFLKEGMENMWFGRGIGAATVANMGEVRGGFRVPHNEYIRTFLEGGVVGLFLLMVSFFIFFRKIYGVIEQTSKWGFLALVMGFAIYSVTDNTLSTTQFSIPFAWYLGVIYSRDVSEKFSVLNKENT